MQPDAVADLVHDAILSGTFQGRTTRPDARSAHELPNDPVARLVQGIYSR
jgi:hypothetical protein